MNQFLKDRKTCANKYDSERSVRPSPAWGGIEPHP
jgi:hypothetical protein